MNYKAILMAIALVIAGIGMASASGITYSEHLVRPSTTPGVNVYEYNGGGSFEGFNVFQHQTEATLATFDAMSIVGLQPCVNGAAPLSTTDETMTLNSIKGNDFADPYFLSHIDSWITVGTVNINAPLDPLSRYDTMNYNMEAFFDATGTRGINTMLMSTQDDNIHVLTGNNAGFEYPVLSNYVDVTIPGMPGESQKFRKFNFADNSAWSLTNYDYSLKTTIDYEEFSIPFNFITP
jgi:hypothetical protein